MQAGYIFGQLLLVRANAYPSNRLRLLKPQANPEDSATLTSALGPALARPAYNA